MSIKMSGGLMSCVRENSPPLDIDDAGAISLPPPETPENQKRRRFHPLRNIRRLFRRRTVANADTSAPASPATTHHDPHFHHHHHHHHHNHNRSCEHYTGRQFLEGGSILTTTSTLSSSAHSHSNATSSSGGRSSGHLLLSDSGAAYYHREKREHSADGAAARILKLTDDDSDRDMTEYQRSLSEGRLVDSDYRDPLSQSHDSVFSESRTASTLSIVLKAELVDVLRKRRNRPDASDEDLGLPRSPITPQRNVHTINQSEGSLSHLSMGSTDMEDDNASAFNGHHSTPASSRDTMRGNGSDELDLSISAKLSHSAARHKMAIRPTKRGPTRHRRHIDSTALPSTPEVNEDTIKVPSIEIISPAKIKSQSLPPGVKAHQLENHSAPLKESAQFIDVTPTPPISTTTIYINRNISKSHDFDATKEDSEHKLTTLERKKEEEGFFRRLLHRSSKKRKNSDGHEDDERGLDKKEKLDGRDETDKQKVVQALNDNDMNISGLPQSLNTDVQSGSEKPPIEPLPRSIKPKSGPAARQRMLPQEITVSSPVLIKKPDTIAATCDFLNAEITQENLPPKSPRKLTSAVDSLNESKLLFFPKSTTDVKLSTYCAKKEETKFVKASQCRSEEVLIPSSRKSKEENDTSSHSISPPKSVWPEQTERKLYTPKVFGISSLQQKIGKISNKDDVVEEISPKRGKPVEKSKSFRFYSENTSWNNLQTSGNLPSLPDLSYPKKSASDEDIEPAPFSSMINGSTYDKSSDVKFEINDNNLMMKPRLNESFTKSILLTTSRTPTQSISTGSLNQNITQIEENIDKLVKSSFVTVLNYPNEETRKSNVSVTSINATSSVEKPVTPVEPKEEKPEPVAAPKHERTIAIASSETIAPVATPPQQPPTTPPKPRRSSSIFEKSPSTSSLCTSTPTATGGVPEFMKIQLNRVDSARGKCHVVLSKNMREQEARERRLSNDSVEVNDTKPPLPPDVPSKRSSWTKSQDNDLDQQPESPVRKTFERNKSMSDVTKERADEEHRSCVVIERRKSVSDEKLKFERKIEEMKVVERKKSSGDEQGSRKSSIDEDTVVVLRKKSFVVPTSSHKDDTTPELMKVFARRSLKIKDVDDDDADKVKKSPPSVDSDKENQSSSEEKLDKLPKVEISIQNTPAIEKNGNCVVTLTNTKDKEEKPHKKLSESNILQKNIIMPPKPTIFTPTRFSNVTNFRTTASFLDVRKSLSATAPSAVGQKDEQNNNQNNANTVKNNNNNNNANNNSTFVNQLNNNNNNNVSNHRHTLGTASPLVEKAARIEVGEINVEGSTPQQSEFKGILQRRAEWEKRAKEAFK